MKLKRSLKSVHLLLMVMLLIAIAGCQKPLLFVQVSETTGNVLIKREKPATDFAAVAGMNLVAQDTISTAAASYATLNIDNVQNVSIWEKVELRIAELLSKSNALKGTKFDLLSGKVYIRIQKALNPGESFEISTPTCIMGVRGTQFFVSADSQATELAVLQGEVALSLKSAPEKIMVIKANQRVVINQEVRSIDELEPVPIIQSELDLMVLKEIKKQPEGIAPFLLEGIDQEIQRKEETSNLTLLGVEYGEAQEHFKTQFKFKDSSAMIDDGWTIQNEAGITFNEQGNIIMEGAQEISSVRLTEGIPENTLAWRVSTTGQWLGGDGHSWLNIQVDTQKHSYVYVHDGASSEYALLRDGEKVLSVPGYQEVARKSEKLEIEMIGDKIYTRSNEIQTGIYIETDTSPVTAVGISSAPGSRTMYIDAQAYVGR